MQRGAFSLAAVSTFPITARRPLAPLNFHPPAHSRTANTYPNIALPDCCALEFLREFWGTESSGLRAATSPEHTVMILLVGVGPKLRPHEFVSGIRIRTNACASIPSEVASFAALGHGLNVRGFTGLLDRTLQGMVEDGRDEDLKGANLSSAGNLELEV